MTVADAFGAAPTLRKSWGDPTSESPRFFALFAVSAFVTLLTVTQWTIVTAAFSLYLLTLYVILFILVRFKVGLLFQRVTLPMVDESEP